LVTTILEVRKQDEDSSIEEYEKEIDNLVFSLYGLTADEIEQIEKKYNVK